MADPARTHSDGTLPWGTQKVTIPTGGEDDYIAESISIDADSDVIESKNEFGVVYRDALIETPVTGSCTLQFAGLTTPLPEVGARFTLVPTGGGAAKAFKVKKVGTPQEQSGERKVSIDFREVFNP